MEETTAPPDDPAAPMPAASPPAPAHLPVAQIGDFEILGVIGAGGMGAVYRARQRRPNRVVALKVVRPGLLSPALLRRFEYEAEVLGRLQHEGIAQVFGAGVDPGTGQPFFAMELIEGERLDVHIEQTQPDLPARLRLLIRICQAVHYAHTRGVVHRDLKPANIIVTKEGQPKVLDFGVARLTDADMQAATLHTETGAILGTLAYMAPEQASGAHDEVDTRADVYALGVMAYELLSGRLPLAISGKPLPAAVRAIMEEEPSRLSSADRNLRGDLETIVGKAMAKEKASRYDSAAALAEDVRRYLEYEPISARPPSTWYNLRKFARRNKSVVAGVAAVFVVLLAGLAGTSYGLVQANQQRRLALMEAERVRQAQQVAVEQRNEAQRQRALADAQAQRAEAALRRSEAAKAFMQDVLRQADPRVAGRNDVTVRQAVDVVAPAVDERFREVPDVHAGVLLTLGQTYKQLGEATEAVQYLRQALAVGEEAFGTDSLEQGDAHAALSSALFAAESFDESWEHLKQAEAIYARHLPEDDPRLTIVRGDLGLRVAATQKYDPSANEAMSEADLIFVRQIAFLRGISAEEFRQELVDVTRDVRRLWLAGDREGAERLIREFISPLLKIPFVRVHLPTGLLNLAVRQTEYKDFALAEAVEEVALELCREIQGEESAELAQILIASGMLRVRRQDIPGAQERLWEGLIMGERLKLEQGPDHRDAVIYLSRVLLRQKKFVDVLALVNRKLDRISASESERLFLRVVRLTALAGSGDTAGADAEAREVLDALAHALERDERVGFNPEWFEETAQLMRERGDDVAAARMDRYRDQAAAMIATDTSARPTTASTTRPVTRPITRPEAGEG